MADIRGSRVAPRARVTRHHVTVAIAAVVTRVAVVAPDLSAYVEALVANFAAGLRGDVVGKPTHVRAGCVARSRGLVGYLGGGTG